jgi:hypothetical protein
MKKCLTLCLLVAFLAVASNGVCAISDNYVVNGDFEVFENLQPGPASWTVFKSIPGWDSNIGGGIEIMPSGTAATSQSGRYHVELDSYSNSNMTQSLLLSEGSYELSFWYKPRTNTKNDNNIDFSLAGIFSDSIFDVSGSQANWKKVTKELSIGSDGSYDLAFVAGGKSNSLGGLIDNVSLTKVRSSNPIATPIPSSLALLLSGVAGFVVLKRKKAMN